jgi:hypothetical protein
VYSR